MPEPASGRDIPLWDDNPSVDDLLGFSDVATPVIAALLREQLDPVCAGIFGPWGSGKTTVLGLVQGALQDDESVLVVYTQPWAYDPTTDPKATLIGEVLGEVRGRIAEDQEKLDKVRGKLKSLAGRIRWAKAVRLAGKSALTASLPSLDDLEGLFGSEDELSEPTLEGFREEFSELLADSAFQDLRRVVVVVDDLDRCLPESVVGSLEAIKLFLAVPKMAFLLAADDAAVAHAIAKSMGDTEDAHDRARKYLEKIVQVPVRIPALGLAETEAFLAQLFLARQGDISEVEISKVRKYCAERRAQGATGLIDGLEDELDGTGDLALARRLAPILYEELQGNPRRLKRFLNAYGIRGAIARARGIGFDESVFAKLMVLEELYPQEFRELLGWLASGSLGQRLSELEAMEGEYPQQLQRWGAMEPRVANLDLTPYLLLAASLSGLPVTERALPEHLRELASMLVSPTEQERTAGRERIADLVENDRVHLAVYLADAICLQPARQASLAESLMAVIGDREAVGASAAGNLRRLGHGEIEIALPVTLVNQKHAVSAMRELVAGWASSEDASEQVRNAAKLALKETAG